MKKVYVSNVYGMIVNQRIAQRQDRVATVGRSIGYFELGIYNYPAQNEPKRDLSKRIEGILAAIHNDDVVILQLPTGNGERFDTWLAQKIRERKAKVIMLWHSVKYYLEQQDDLAIWSDYEVSPSTLNEALGYGEDSLAKKILIDACYMVMREDSNKDIIHIGMGVHDQEGNACTKLGVSMQSVVDHTDEEIMFHILHDDTLTIENKRRLTFIAMRAGMQIEFHNVEEYNFRFPLGFHTKGTAYQILLPEVCDGLSRIIYLDLDVLVNLDVKKIWNIDISDYCLAMVQKQRKMATMSSMDSVIENGKIDRGLNAGMIYMNLDKIRQRENMCDTALDYIEQNEDPDLNVLSLMYIDSILPLDAGWLHLALDVHAECEQELKEGIYYYTGTECLLYFNTQMDVLYMQTSSKTPWGGTLLKKYIDESLETQLGRIDTLRKNIVGVSV